MGAGVEIEITETVDETTRTDSNLPYDNEDGMIKFTIPPTNGFLLKPDINLHLQITVDKVVNGSATKVTDEDKICLTNYPLMSLFRSADIEINQKPVIPANTLTAYTAQIRALQEFDKDGRNGLLSRSLWHQDLAGWHNKPGKQSEEARDPYIMRHDPITNGKVVDLYGPLMLDIFRQSQPFPDDIEIRITLYMQKTSFVINGPEPPAGTTYRITIHKADLCFNRLRMPPNTDVYKEAGPNIKYPFVSYETRHFTVPERINTVSQEILNGPLPNRIIFLFLDQEGYVGKYSLNGFNFEHFNPRTIYLRKNQIISIPTDMFTTEVRRVPNEPTDAEVAAEAARISAERAAAQAEKDRQRALNKVSDKNAGEDARNNPPQGTGGTGGAGGGTGRSSGGTGGSSGGTGGSGGGTGGSGGGTGGSGGGSGGGTGGTGGANKNRDEPRHRRGKRIRYEIYEDELERLVEKRLREERRRRRRQRDVSEEESDDDSFREVRIRRDATKKVEDDLILINYSRLYVESMKVLNNFDSLNRIDIGVTYEDFKAGYFMLAANLKADRVQRTNKVQLPMFGVIRLEMTFHRVLPKPILILAILEYQRVHTIPKDTSADITVE